MAKKPALRNSSLIDSQRIKRAIQLFSSDRQTLLMTTYERLAVELAQRLIVSQQFKKVIHEFQRIGDLAAYFHYSSFRVSEVFLRLYQIQWMKETFKKTSDSRILWNLFAALAIKDFHTDISSTMDSIAPVVIRTKGDIKQKDKKKLPGFPDIQSGTKRTYREKIPRDILVTIDSTDRWWPTVKDIRDLLVHREHNKIIFGQPTDGILFQIYESLDNPKILETPFLSKVGKNIVDFELYSAFVMGELLVLLDELGRQIASHLGIAEEGLPHGYRSDNFQNLFSALNRLIDL